MWFLYDLWFRRGTGDLPLTAPTMPRSSARPAVHITKRTIDALKLEAADYFAWDDEVKGFGVRVYASGRKVFVLKYRVRGDLRTRRENLGDYPTLTPAQARDAALERKRIVTKPENVAAERQKTTLDDVVKGFFEERETKRKPRTVTEYRRLWRASLAPTFGALRIGALSEEHVMQWHEGRKATPMVANRGVDLLMAVCTWAEKRKYRPKGSNPCTRECIERYPEQTRKRSLTVEEYQRMGSAFSVSLLCGLPPAPALVGKTRGVSSKKKPTTERKRGPYKARAPFLLPAGGYLNGGVTPSLVPANPTAAAVLRFLALTGWREQEALALRWDALDLPHRVAILADTKTGRSVRALGSAAVALLKAQTEVDGNPYVFPGAKKGAHLAETRHLWGAVRHAVGATVRLHDLRHSFATTARRLGYGDHVIAALIGHKLDSMTSKYGDVPEELTHAAADKIAATIAQYLSGETAKVLPLAPRLERVG